MPTNGPSKAGSTRAAVRHSKHLAHAAVGTNQVCNSPAAGPSGACADFEADEDDDFASEIAGAPNKHHLVMLAS